MEQYRAEVCARQAAGGQELVPFVCLASADWRAADPVQPDQLRTLEATLRKLVPQVRGVEWVCYFRKQREFYNGVAVRMLARCEPGARFEGAREWAGNHEVEVPGGSVRVVEGGDTRTQPLVTMARPGGMVRVSVDALRELDPYTARGARFVLDVSHMRQRMDRLAMVNEIFQRKQQLSGVLRTVLDGKRLQGAEPAEFDFHGYSNNWRDAVHERAAVKQGVQVVLDTPLDGRRDPRELDVRHTLAEALNRLLELGADDPKALTAENLTLSELWAQGTRVPVLDDDYDD
jgi:hypothetical protein